MRQPPHMLVVCSLVAVVLTAAGCVPAEKTRYERHLAAFVEPISSGEHDVLLGARSGTAMAVPDTAYESAQ
jgi:hypothetical protein